MISWIIIDPPGLYPQAIHSGRKFPLNLRGEILPYISYITVDERPKVR